MWVRDDHVLTVSDLTRDIKTSLQDRFSSVWVTGEISDLAQPNSGHIYLTLKDDRSQIRAVIWRNTATRLRVPLDDGLEILCRGDIDVYPPRGTYQLACPVRLIRMEIHLGTLLEITKVALNVTRKPHNLDYHLPSLLKILRSSSECPLWCPNQGHLP